MPQFEIYFFGLITHISRDVGRPNRKQEAGLIRDARHTAHLFVNGVPHTVIREMETNLGRGEAAVHSSFGIVPQLARATRRNDGRDVRIRNAAFVSTFFYPPGTTLMVARQYDSMAQIGFKDEEPFYVGCIGTVEVAVFNAGSQNIFINPAGQQIPLSSSDVIVFFNGSMIGHNHFELHKNATDADEIAEMIDVTSPFPCPDLNLPVQLVHLKQALDLVNGTTKRNGLGIFDSTQVDCSSSQWP